jgi:hypothetical protein
VPIPRSTASARAGAQTNGIHDALERSGTDRRQPDKAEPLYRPVRLPSSEEGVAGRARHLAIADEPSGLLRADEPRHLVIADEPRHLAACPFWLASAVGCPGTSFSAA